MRLQITIILLSFLCLSCYSKRADKFALFYFHTVPDSLKYGVDYQWTVNSKSISEQGDTVKLKINYPNFDTIRLVNNSNKDVRIIITRFDPGHIYEMSNYSDCDDAAIHDTRNYKSGQKLLWTNEIGIVVFEIKNYLDTILIAGTYGDIRHNFTRGTLLKNNKTIRIEDPIQTEPSCFCFHIKIGMGSIREENNLYEDYRFTNFRYDIDKVFAIEDELFHLEYKFFNKETLTVIYDNKSKTVRLQLN